MHQTQVARIALGQCYVITLKRLRLDCRKHALLPRFPGGIKVWFWRILELVEVSVLQSWHERLLANLQGLNLWLEHRTFILISIRIRYSQLFLFHMSCLRLHRFELIILVSSSRTSWSLDLIWFQSFSTQALLGNLINFVEYPTHT